MSATVDQAFITLFTSETKLDYQRGGSALKDWVFKRTSIGADTVRFPKLGQGTATQKARHADVTPMNLGHSNVSATMEDWYAPEYIDKLDEIKTNENLRGDYAQSAGFALARQTDDIIIADALSSNTDQGTQTAMNLLAVQEAQEFFNEGNVPMSQRRAMISPKSLTDLQNIDEFKSADFNVTRPLVGAPHNFHWMGFDWIVHTGLPLTGTDRTNFFWHDRAIGVGWASDVQTEINYIAEKVSHLVNAFMSMGAVLIDDNGVFEQVTDES